MYHPYNIKKKSHLNNIIVRICVAICLLLFHPVLPSVANTLPQGKMAYTGGKSFYYRLYLRDKRHTAYSLERPYEFLSPKSISRRIRQKLTVDSTDIPVSQVYLDSIRNSGLIIVGTSKWHNTVLVKSKLADIDLLASHFNFIVNKKMVFESPDSIDATTRKQIHNSLLPSPFVNDSSSVYAAADMQISRINGKQLHERGFKGKGMTIAVLDGGFMNVDKIPAFDNVDIITKRNFVDDGCTDICNEIDHGTKVLSAMAVNQPRVYVGTAPEAQYVLLRSEDYNNEVHVEEDYWTMAAEYADSMGVDLINSSLGYHRYDDDTKHTAPRQSQLDGKTSFVSQSASMLAGKGMILVNSAGNEGMGSWKKVGFPADATDILAVGAMSPDSINAAFSSIGPTADGRVKPDVMAPGCPACVVTGKGTMADEVGTSFAAPVVCGLVACLWQAFPTKTAKEIIDMVRHAASQHDKPDNIFGYGVANFNIDE